MGQGKFLGARVDPAVLAEFHSICEKNRTNASDEIRRYVEAVVREGKLPQSDDELVPVDVLDKRIQAATESCFAELKNEFTAMSKRWVTVADVHSKVMEQLAALGVVSSAMGALQSDFQSKLGTGGVHSVMNTLGADVKSKTAAGVFQPGITEFMDVQSKLKSPITEFMDVQSKIGAGVVPSAISELGADVKSKLTNQLMGVTDLQSKLKSPITTVLDAHSQVTEQLAAFGVFQPVMKELRTDLQPKLPTQLPELREDRPKVTILATEPTAIKFYDHAHGLQQNKLAERLGCSDSSLSQKKKDPKKLREFTAEKDPDGFAWRWDAKERLYFFDK